MSKKSTTPTNKAPRTVKQSTVFTVVFVLFAILASFIGGWFTHINYESQVKQEAHSLVKELSVAAPSKK